MNELGNVGSWVLHILSSLSLSSSMTNMITKPPKTHYMDCKLQDMRRQPANIQQRQATERGHSTWVLSEQCRNLKHINGGASRAQLFVVYYATQQHFQITGLCGQITALMGCWWHLLVGREDRPVTDGPLMGKTMAETSPEVLWVHVSYPTN